MNATARIVRRLRAAADLGAELDALEAEIKAARSRRNGKATPSRQKTRKEERAEAFAAIRAEVVERAGNHCELDGQDGEFHKLEAHHLVSGGLRQHRESPETLILLCMDCHRALHRNERHRLRAAKEWCLRLGYREALAEVDRRLAKVTP